MHLINENIHSILYEKTTSSKHAAILMADKSDNSFKMRYNLWFCMSATLTHVVRYIAFCYNQYDLPFYLDGKHNILFSIDTI